jgi:succinate dehydrogenase / fumarate reductase cytochrome b subunit
MNVLLRPLRSSLGAKYLMALTGVGLLGFVVAHMLGNLLIYAGPDALNSYAQSLKDHPGLLWTARTGLLAIFLLHLLLGFRLSAQNRSARGVRYVYEDTVQASWASRNMLLTGLVLFAFIVYHLAHFTFGVVQDYYPPNSVAEANERESRVAVVMNITDFKDMQDPARTDPHHTIRHDVYRMVVVGFRNPWIALSYVVAQVFLWLHLSHGGSSWFQSLGLNHTAYNPLIRAFGPVLATAILIGNCSIPLAVMAKVVGGSVS